MPGLAQRLNAIRPALAVKSAAPVTIPFTEWRPDLPAFANPGMTEANGVMPRKASYSPVGSLMPLSNALDGPCLGAIRTRDNAGNIFLYAGTEKKLYELIGDTFTDQSGDTYATGGDDNWEFVVWEPGQLIIATNGSDPVQSLDIGSGSSDDFGDLITGTNKPTAKHMAVVRNFLVLGNTEDTTDGTTTSRVWWSALLDPESFDPDAAEQSDYEDLAAGGAVQKVLGGTDYGVIFQTGLIRRMQYVGSPLVWSFPIADKDRGSPVPNSIVQYGRTVFYVSEAGFFAFDGYQSHAIGEGKVDRTFWRQFDASNKVNMSVAIDPLNKLVIWAFPGHGSADGKANKLYFYKWDDGKWSEADMNVNCVTDVHTPGVTLEDLDSESSNIDALTFSLDAERWKAGEALIAAFTRDYKLSSFEGPTLPATLTTGERQLFRGRTVHVRRVRPLIDGAMPAVAIAGRPRHSDISDFGTPVAIEPAGWCPVKNRARYQRFRLTTAAGETWDHAQGVEVTAAPGGVR